MSEKVFGNTLKAGSSIALGVDQSLTAFSMTAINLDDPSEYISWVFKPEGTGVKRLDRIRDWMIEKFEYLTQEMKCEVKDAAMEGTVVASHSASVLGELSAVVRLMFYDYFTDSVWVRYPLRVPPATLKKYVTGKGNSKKQEMLLGVYKNFGVEFADDNAADSYSLSRLASGRADTSVEASIIKQMEDPKYRDKY